MAPSTYTRIYLQERPKKDITSTTFKSEKLPFGSLTEKLGKGQSLVQVTWLSLDPAMRGYLNDVRSYLPPVKIGETMRALGLGVVIQTGPGSKFKVGDNVTGPFGWTEYAVMRDKDVQLIKPLPGAEPLDYLNTLGSSGMTAYFGLHDVIQIKPKELLLVSGAAGSVGSIVCQLGLQAGARVIAIAGSQDKCEWLEKDLGVEKALNYKSSTFKKDLRSLGYIDAYFDNVGGEILDLVLTRLQKNARIALCGAISAYNDPSIHGLKNYMTLISMRAKIQGFIVMDYESRYPEAVAAISKSLKDGSLKRKFHIVEGLEKAPVALPMLFSGGNTGKLVLKVSDEPKLKAKL